MLALTFYLLGTFIYRPGTNNTSIKSPLLPKDTAGSGYGTQENKMVMRNDISSSNRKRKNSVEEEDDEDNETKDWWTKYYSSVERMCEETKEVS